MCELITPIKTALLAVYSADPQFYLSQHHILTVYICPSLTIVFHNFSVFLLLHEMFLNLFLQSIVQKLILWATYFMKNVLKVCRNAFILDCFPYRGNVLPEKRSWWQILDFVFTTECLCPIAACSGAYLSNFMFQFKFCTAYVICLQMLWKMRF